jgi:hypothetical protein
MSRPPSHPQLVLAGTDVLKEFVLVRLRRTALRRAGRPQHNCKPLDVGSATLIQLSHYWRSECEESRASAASS